MTIFSFLTGRQVRYKIRIAMAFLGIRVPHETGRLLTNIEVPGKVVSPSEMHITLLHFEENWPISEMVKALETTFEIVSKIKPFIAMTENVICFPKREGQAAIVAQVKSAELHELREKLAKEFDEAKIEFSKTFKDYKPHITLSYNDEEIDDFDIDPVEFAVQEIVLWGGDHGDDRIFVTFPLKGPEKQKHALLLQKAVLFEKMAKKLGNELLTPTKERRKVQR
jgi:2'-5' RNA ligase